MFSSIQDIMSYLPHVKLYNTKEELPNVPGVYFIIGQSDIDSQQIILYIGQSGNLQQRFKTHHVYQQCLAYDRLCEVYWLNCWNHVELEKTLISKFTPKFNKLILKDAQSLHNEFVLSELKKIKDALKRIEDQLYSYNGSSLYSSSSAKRQCPECNSFNIVGNGSIRHKKRYKCKDCNKTFSQ